MKVIKWLVIALFILCVAFAAYISLFFNPNDFKPQIIEFVKEKTGRQLSIKDDLTWTFFPHMGIKLGGISLSNPQGFEYPQMLQVREAVADVELLPLLQKAVIVQQLKLDGLTFILETQADGHSGLDGLTSTNEAQSGSTDTSSKADMAANISRLEIGGIAITNSQVLMVNQQTNSEQVFSLNELTLGRFQLGEFATIDYELTAKLPDMVLKSEGQGAVRLDKQMQNVKVKDLEIKNEIKTIGSDKPAFPLELILQVAVDLKNKSLSLGMNDIAAMDLHGSANIDANYGKKIPDLAIKLDFDELNVDTLSAAMSADTKNASKQSKEAPKEQLKEPDLSALKKVNVNAEVTIKSVKMNNLKSTNWNMKAQLQNGILNMRSLTADLYKGQLVASASLDAQQAIPRYSFKKSITGVEIRPLLQDAADVGLLAGLTNLSIEGKGSSFIPDNIKQNLIASGKFEVVDGALYGINIPQMLRQAQAKLTGANVTAGNEEKKTDFTRLTGSFNIAKGVVSNDDLIMASPLIRINGQGSVNIVTQALDYQLLTKVVGSLEGQGGQGSNTLKGIDIPLKITGTVSAPKFALDTDALLKGKVKQEADKLEKKLKDKLLDKLGGL
ncbi:AsmA family protein [uncultured Shewanella sp.]|uniref:AsmA family protein n=1 Tax=uncultured Shewanella sp. TaxID=173975 RepID=UPI00262A05F3|nr:AsmA family protein [uncultured Shewanella sp.]